MDGIFGRGRDFDSMLLEEWDRDELIKMILKEKGQSFTKDELKGMSVEKLRTIAKT